MLITAIALGMWLNDRGRMQSNEVWYQRPDAAAEWSICLAGEANP
jgi:hypothetical protein